MELQRLQVTTKTLECIPRMDMKDVVYGVPHDYYGRNAGRQIENVSLKDYREYINTLQTSGFCKVSENERGLHDIYYTVVLRKEELFLYMMYFVPRNCIFLNLNTNPYEVAWNAKDVFESVPIIRGKESEFRKPEDFGAGNYVVTIKNIERTAYRSYMQLMEQNGFEKYVDNSVGVDSSVFSSTYVKDRVVVTLTYLEKTKLMYVSATFDQALSPHLLPDNNEMDGQEENMQISLHMLKLVSSGNSFVWQLKNGHFLISDGGKPVETESLIAYLEELAPNGEKPVIDGWFISHGHIDHCGVLQAIFQNPKYADRIYVEGVYFNEPQDLVLALDPWLGRGAITFFRDGVSSLKTTKGKTPELYRTHTGQKYYFCGVTVDIVLGQEQLPYCDYSGDMNDSSTWCMFHVEEQKVLFGGDGDKGGFSIIEANYSKEYARVDAFSLLHHGHNTRDYITDYFTVKTLLDTCDGETLPDYRHEANQHLKESVEEWISWRDGTKILTFPYKVGEYQKKDLER